MYITTNNQTDGEAAVHGEVCNTLIHRITFDLHIM